MNFAFALQRVLACGAVLLLLAPGALPVNARLIWDGDRWLLEGETERSAEELTAGLERMTSARKAHEAGELGRALADYKEVIEEYEGTILAPEALWQTALIRVERLQWTRGFGALQRIVDEYPDYPGFQDVISEQFAIADALRQGARLRLFWIIPGFRSPERAVEYFEQIVTNAPFSEYAPKALLHAANLQGDLNNLDEAIDLYDRFISDYPNHEDVADAYFGLAEAFSSRMRGPAYDQGANREAIGYYEDFVLLYPDHPRAAEAEEQILEMSEVLAQSRIILGDFYFNHRDNFHAARVFYNEAITIAPQSETAADARDKLAQVEIEQERHERKSKPWLTPTR